MLPFKNENGSITINYNSIETVNLYSPISCKYVFGHNTTNEQLVLSPGSAAVWS